MEERRRRVMGKRRKRKGKSSDRKRTKTNVGNKNKGPERNERDGKVNAAEIKNKKMLGGRWGIKELGRRGLQWK